MAHRSVVGDVINFGGMVYAPVSEMGVVALFARVCENLGFIIEEIRAAFPDCRARRQVDHGWEQVALEFEYRSSNFRRHGHPPQHCDLIVCWEHDWETCPVPVLSLKSYVAEAQASVSAPLGRVRIADPLETRQTTITDGGIRNGYINIKPLDDFWPEECVGGNTERAPRPLIVEFEGVGRVATDISGRHKTFRTTKREVKEFVRQQSLAGGDELEIVRVNKYEYRVRPIQRQRPR